jgi:hypothetical protein
MAALEVVQPENSETQTEMNAQSHAPCKLKQ